MRKIRQPGAVPRTSTSSASATDPVLLRPFQSCPSAGVKSLSRPVTGEWICQFAGLSGDQDPFVMSHCSFNHLNCYKTSDWAVLRIKGENDVPLHFTVCSQCSLLAEN